MDEPTVEKVKRYREHACAGSGGDYWATMDLEPDGEYVQYSDFLRLEAEKNQLLEIIDEQAKSIVASTLARSCGFAEGYKSGIERVASEADLMGPMTATHIRRALAGTE